MMILLALPSQGVGQEFEYALDGAAVSGQYLQVSGYSSWSFGGNPTAQLVDYLANEHTRKQLEFSDEQNKQYRAIQQQYSKAYSDMYAKYPELKQKDIPRQARAELNRKVQLAGKKLREEFSEKVRETLIPQQVNLLTTLRFKQMSQLYGFASAVSNAPVADRLKITTEQKKELTKIKQESDAAIQKKLAEMKAEAKSKMMKVLNAKQRKMLSEIEGDETKAPK